MSLNVVHVLFVVLTTTVGASVGRGVRNRWRRLRYLNEATRAVIFLVGMIFTVWFLAGSHASGVAKAALAGLYIGAFYGLFASDPKPRRVRRGVGAGEDGRVPPDRPEG